MYTNNDKKNISSDGLIFYNRQHNNIETENNKSPTKSIYVYRFLEYSIKFLSLYWLYNIIKNKCNQHKERNKSTNISNTMSTDITLKSVASSEPSAPPLPLEEKTTLELVEVVEGSSDYASYKPSAPPLAKTTLELVEGEQVPPPAFSSGF